MIDIFEVRQTVPQPDYGALKHGLKRAHDHARLQGINKKWARKPISKTRKVYQETSPGTTEKTARWSFRRAARGLPTAARHPWPRARAIAPGADETATGWARSARASGGSR